MKAFIYPALFALSIFFITCVCTFALNVTDYAGQIGIAAGVCTVTFLLAVDPFWED